MSDRGHLRLEFNHDLLTIPFFSGKGTAGNEKKKDSHKSHKEPKTEPPKSQVSGRAINCRPVNSHSFNMSLTISHALTAMLTWSS